MKQTHYTVTMADGSEISVIATDAQDAEVRAAEARATILAQTILRPGESRDYANGYVARSWRTERPYYAERTGDTLSPEFATFAEAYEWLAA